MITTGDLRLWPSDSSALATLSNAELAREACAALARATWFAEYLELRFAAVRTAARQEEHKRWRAWLRLRYSDEWIATCGDLPK